MKNRTLVGIDIGTSKISVIIGYLGEGGKIEVIGVGGAPSRGLRKGVVIHIDHTVQAITDAVVQAETMAGIQVKSVLTSFSGSHIRGTSSHGVVAIKNREVRTNDIERVVESAKAIPISQDREVLHVLPQEFVVDDQDGIKDPIGISGVRLEAHVHIITGSVSSAENIVKCANRCGLNVQDIIVSPLASARAVLSQEEQDLGVCLIDIGAGTADIMVIHNGAVKFTSVVPLGGNHITNDLAAGLRTPILAAEELKCKHGSALKSLVGRNESVEILSTGRRPPRMLSKHVVAEIIEPRVREILSLCAEEIERSGCGEALTGGVVLTGGCSNLVGIAQVAEQTFHLPVRIGNPVGFGGVAELIHSPEYATAVGLLVQGAIHSGNALSESHLIRGGGLKGSLSSKSLSDAGMSSSNQSSRLSVFKKVGNWIADHF